MGISETAPVLPLPDARHASEQCLHAPDPLARALDLLCAAGYPAQLFTVYDAGSRVAVIVLGEIRITGAMHGR
jgi:hypothetical protein